MDRPGPLHWLRYAAGGSLPARYNAWVLHDTTCSTWVLRHLARALVLLAIPAIALLLFLPGGMPLRILTVVTVAGCSLLLLAILTNEITERRVHKAGYPWGTAEATRSHRAAESQRRTAQRHRERIARRR